MQKYLNRSIAFFVFLISLAMYSITLSPTVAFWDVGEFCAAGYLLQVPHPPGSPLFLLILRIASMLPTSADLAVRMHMVSAFAGALTVMLTYLCAVKIISFYRGKPASWLDNVIVYSSSALGAFALAFSFSFWFNAVEAEVYGTGMLFVAAVFWLILRWYERADEPRNEKYLFLIAYLMGLSIGVHLGALLMLFGIIFIYFFKKTTIPGDDESTGKVAGALASQLDERTGTIAGVLALASQLVMIFFGAIEAAGLFSIALMAIMLVVLAYRITLIKFLIFLGATIAMFVAIYSGIVQGFPKMMGGNVAGSFGKALPFLLVIAAAYFVYVSQKTKNKILHIASVSFLLIVIGYSTYALVIIRANVPNIPMNENDPSDFTGLVRYISREQYGEQPKFMPRRWSPEPQHQGIYINYRSDMDFMWQYQIAHMYNRYLQWNFIGRANDVQDSGVRWDMTFGIPIFLGLFGMYFHFRKDWKLATTLFALFLITGVILALYQNQQQPQPRERDYFYTSAFMVFALWIAVAIAGIIDTLTSVLKRESLNPSIAIAVIVLGLVTVPVNLARMNYQQNNRSGNFVAWDHSYNMLQSCKPNAILFTNGDNDTFPLWYLQDVEGVRRDVRIVNLSLVNTDWYIKQLKHNTPHGAQTVPVSFTDDEIEQLQPIRWETREMSIPISKHVFDKYLELEGLQLRTEDSALINKGKLTFTMEPTMDAGDIKAIRIQDIMIYEIIRTNNWQRPVHFAVTCSPDSKIGLDNYLWYQGLGWELKPMKIPNDDEGIDTQVLAKQVMSDIPMSKTPQYGYLFRNLNNPSVIFDENARRMLQNYRTAFLRLAIDYSQTKNDNPKANEVLERMEAIIPRSVIPMDWRIMGDVRLFFQRVGNAKRAEEYANALEAECRRLIDNNEGELTGYYSPYRFLLDIYNEKSEWNKALDVLNDLKTKRPNDKGIDAQIKSLEARIASGNQNDSAK